MSVLRVNEIRSQTGNTILIPSGHELVLDTTPINSNALPPNSSGNNGKFLKSSDGASIGWESVGPVAIRTFTTNGTWTRPAGVTKIKHLRTIEFGNIQCEQPVMEESRTLLRKTERTH